MTATKDVMRDVTGDEYEGCPWRVFSDPYVYDVIRAYGWYESGQIAIHFGGVDGPNIIVEGIAHYHGTLNRIRLDMLERAERKRNELHGLVQTVAPEDLKIVGVSNG